MIIGGDLMERLRPLVSSKNWDYYVLWRLSEDQRFLEWMSCCCGGGYDDENVSGNGCGDYNDKLKDLVYPFSSISSSPCRDLMLQHPRTTPTCHLLADLPSSIPLDSGIYAQALMLGQAMWLNFCSERSDSTIQGITFGTRVLIPLPIGLVELFVTKQVHEDQETIEFVTSQCNITLKEEAMNPSFFDQNIENETHPKLFSYDHENNETPLPNPFHSHQQSIVENTKNDLFGELTNREYLENRDIVKKGNGNSESISDCSEEDREGGKCENRNGKGHQSKNLLAERKRRKKLNDRLFALRALVPLITKMDKASILGDAILYMKELQKQVKELQQDLESHSEDDCDTNISIKLKKGSGQSEFINQISAKNENLIHLKQEDCSGTYDHKPRQMEPQVEVVQLDGNELFVKVFCEQKAGGLVRLMEGFNSLGLEVINVTITSFRSLVSNVFRLEMKDSKMLEADYVKDTLLEIIRNYS